MSGGSGRAYMANKMFELKTKVKDELNSVANGESLTSAEKELYNSAVALYEKRRYTAALEKLLMIAQKK